MSDTPNPAASHLKFSVWFPYSIAACLMAVGVTEASEIFQLTAVQRELVARLGMADAEAERLRASLALSNLQVSLLEPRDPAYATVKAVVVWDINQHRGAWSVRDLPPVPAGHDYQLWVLDPNAPAPYNAGLLNGPDAFAAPAVSVAKPGFAVSLENAGGSPTLSGPILFAVAPGE